MINFDREWATATYADLIRENPAGLDIAKAKDMLAHEYADAVECGRVQRWRPDLLAEGELIFDGIVRPFRRRQNRVLRKNVEWLLDALADPDAGVFVEPILALPFPLGNGTDKTLRYWDRDDYHMAIMERYRNAADVTAAASAFDELASRLIDRLNEAGAATTGELFGEHEPVA